MNSRPTTGWAALAAVTAAGLVTAVLGQTPALAHELRVVVVESESPATTDARRGFRLAVDQSPDVSHLPGLDGGDHLGGVDVELLSVDVTGRGRQTPDRVEQLLDGAAAVLVFTDVPAVDVVTNAAAARGILVISGTPSPPARGNGSRIELRLKPPEERNRGRMEAFAVTFTDAYGMYPTDAALLGFDAGLLLDRLVAQVGDVLSLASRLGWWPQFDRRAATLWRRGSRCRATTGRNQKAAPTLQGSRHGDRRFLPWWQWL